MSRGLDFLCVTETWLSLASPSLLLNSHHRIAAILIPRGCRVGKEEEKYLFLKVTLNAGTFAWTSFTSFELCLFELGRSHVVLCAVIYRPPKYSKDFISDFSEFLAEILPKYERVLIIDDFNIHTFCPDELIWRNFLNVIDSFNFLQSVCGPTHELGHTLDWVLSHGLCVSNLDICDTVFSDHMLILFDIPTQCPVKPYVLCLTPPLQLCSPQLLLVSVS